MKKIQGVLAAAAMFFVILALLLTSFQVVIYGDPEYRFFRSLYEKYQVTEDLHMEMEDVMDVTEYMMAYLIGQEEELSFVTHVDGREQDFFHTQDRLHMADVKRLFLGGLFLRNVLAAAALALILVLCLEKADVRHLLARAYRRAFLVFAALLAVLGVGIAVDFTACFRLFHEIFFTNSLWLFDPATDYMIRMLPEGFFFAVTLRIGVCFVAGLGALVLLFVLWGRLAGGIRRGKKGGEDHGE